VTYVTSVRPVVRVLPPNTAADCCSNNNQSFPDPQRQEHDPVTPLDNPIKSQCEQQRKYQEAAIDHKLAVTINQSINLFAKTAVCQSYRPTQY